MKDEEITPKAKQEVDALIRNLVEQVNNYFESQSEFEQGSVKALIISRAINCLSITWHNEFMQLCEKRDKSFINALEKVEQELRTNP